MNSSMWILTLLGQAAPDTSAVDAVKVQSIWDFMLKGGPMMIPIGICSLVAFTIVIERWISLRRGNIIPSSFLPGLKKVLDDGMDDRSEALAYCQEDGSPVANVFEAGIKRLDDSVELLEKHIQDAGQRMVLKLRKFLRGLAVIASISPLLGLLGTIFGMITAFQTVAASSASLGKAELLAKGIYEAMITTAAGLMVAIPVLIAYHWVTARIDRLVAEIDSMTVDFIEDYARAPGAGEKRTPRLQPVDPADDSLEDEDDSVGATAAASA